MTEFIVPVLGFAARSGTGKTTLLEQLIAALSLHWHIAAVKHSHHPVSIDTPGKDSTRLREAGAQQVIVAGSQWWSWVGVQNPPHEPNLQEVLKALHTDDLDLILVEGFRDEPFPKIELYRSDAPQPVRFPHDNNIIAIVSDIPWPDANIPVLPFQPLDALLHFVSQFIRDRG